MWLKKTRIILLVLAAILCSSALLTGCVTRAKMDDTLIQNTGITDVSDATTPAAKQTPTPTPIPTPTSMPTTNPTPTPTAISTPTLTSTPVSVFIPRQTLPDGQLFETGYYAVLPGEGAYYNVYDCYGKQIDSFVYPDTEGNPLTGLMTEKDLSLYCRLNSKDVRTVVPEGDSKDNKMLYSNENGFYQIDKESSSNIVYLYNTAGKLVRTLKYTTPEDESANIAVEGMGNETVVTFDSVYVEQKTNTPKESIAIYFVSLDGKINNVCKSSNLSGRPLGLLARKYFIVGPGDGNYMNGDIFDFDGNLIMKDVHAMDMSGFLIWGEEGSIQIYVGNYFFKGGLTYDESFHPVEINQVDTDGKLIYGAKYNVAGITCTATYGRSGQYYSNYGDDIVAVGMQNNQIALKTNDEEYVFAYDGFSYYGMNDYVLLLKKDMGEIEVILLKTGEILYTLATRDMAEIADDYVLVRTGYHSDTGVSDGEYLIDKVGNIRYATQNSSIITTYGENIVLYRGPYVGIADMNGDWVIKTLRSDLTRDDEATNPLNQNLN